MKKIFTDVSHTKYSTAYRLLVETPEEKRTLGAPGVDGRIRVKCVTPK
jgi:hypothetical protein